MLLIYIVCAALGLQLVAGGSFLLGRRWERKAAQTNMPQGSFVAQPSINVPVQKGSVHVVDEARELIGRVRPRRQIF